MKKTLFCLALLWGASSWAAEAVPIQFKAVLIMGSETCFSLCTEGVAERSAWVTAGQKFEGYKVTGYLEKESTLVLAKDGKEFKLALASSKIAEGAAPTATRATVADAEALLQKMNFESLINRMLAQQKQNLAAMAKKMATQAGTDAPDEATEAFQQKVMDTMLEALDSKALQADMAKIYSDVFTKEQLADLGAFYDTATGRAMLEKQPEIAAKTNAVIMPRIAAVMPKIQQMGQEFAQQRAAAKASSSTTQGN